MMIKMAPLHDEETGSYLIGRNKGVIIDALSKVGFPPNPCPRPLSSYIESEEGTHKEEAYLVPLSFIRAVKGFRFDIVTPESDHCSTFTKAYGSKYIVGTGSF